MLFIEKNCSPVYVINYTVIFFQEAKLLYGMLFSIKSFVNKLSPEDLKEGFQSFRTSQYRLNLYETPTKVKFVLNTDTAVTHPVVRDLLKKLHSQVYVEFVVKNPLYQQGNPIESQLFTTKLDEFVQTFAFFKWQLLLGKHS